MSISFTTTGGSSTVTVRDPGHGLLADDRDVGSEVIFRNVSGVSTDVDNLLNNPPYGAHVITGVPTVNTYTITLYEEVGDVVQEAFADDTYNEQGVAEAFYLLQKGLNTSVLGPGWGSGTWGRFTWNSALSSLSGQTLRIWSADNFGEDLIFCEADGGVYYWDATGGVSQRAIPLTSLGTNAGDAPFVARRVLVSEADRHVLAFACNPYGGTEQDKLLIRFSSQEDPSDWTPTATNTAGDIRLGQGSEIITAVRTSRQTLVWTDTSLHSLQFIGPPFTFGESLIADNIRIAGPNAAISVNDRVFWMGQNNFFMYDGRIQNIPCSVRQYVFDDFNRQQSFKVYAGSYAAESEIWWFYPSASSSECDKYVVFNYQQNIWYYGSMARTTWNEAGAGARSYPQATGTDSYLYDQERGLDEVDNSAGGDPVAISSFVESADFDIGDGDQFMLVRRVLPDLTFQGSTAASPSVLFTVKSRDFTGSDFTESPSDNVTRSASSPVEQYTNQVYLRARGRQMAIRVDSTDEGVDWRLGAPRVDARPDGRR